MSHLFLSTIEVSGIQYNIETFVHNIFFCVPQKSFFFFFSYFAIKIIIIKKLLRKISLPGGFHFDGISSKASHWSTVTQDPAVSPDLCLAFSSLLCASANFKRSGFYQCLASQPSLLQTVLISCLHLIDMWTYIRFKSTKQGSYFMGGRGSLQWQSHRKRMKQKEKRMTS